MKRLYFILFLFSISIGVNAQMTLGNLYVGNTLQDKDSIPRQDRWVFDISHEQWLTTPKGIENKLYSWGFAFTRMFEYPFSRNFSLAIGLGVRSLHHYHNGSFAQFVRLDNSIADSIIPIPTTVSYKINKTALNYVDAAAEIRIKAGKTSKFKLYLGFKGGYLFNQHIKYKDSTFKYKKYHTKGFSDFTFGPTVRIGINNISVFANYLLEPVYKNNTGQKIQSCSIGLTFYFL